MTTDHLRLDFRKNMNNSLAELLRKLGFAQKIVVRVPSTYAAPWVFAWVVPHVLCGAVVEWEVLN